MRDHNDVSGIMKGIRALIYNVFLSEGITRNLPLLRTKKDMQQYQNGERQTIILSSVHNEYNAWVNGSTLLSRLSYLDGVYEQEQQRSKEEGGTPKYRQWREKAYLGYGDTAMSPASVRLAKLMLKLIVTEPQRVSIPGRDQFEHDWRDSAGTLDLTHSFEQLGDDDKQLTIRADAREILQHVKLVGYSKGGNIVTDALRYLALELDRDRPRAKGKVFQYLSKRRQDGVDVVEPLDMNQEKYHNVHDLLINCGALTVNPGISPLSDYEKSLGIRRLSVRNGRDWITAHLFERHAMTRRDGTNDDIYVIEPKPQSAQDNLGHGFIDALGDKNIERVGYLADEKQVVSDVATFREMQSRLQCFLASCHERVGIKSIRESDNVKGGYELEFSAGASQKDAEKTITAISAAMGRKRMAISISGPDGTDYDWRHGCAFVVKPKQENPGFKHTLGEVLRAIDNDQKSPVFVGHNVYRDLEVDPPQPGRSAA